MHFLQHPFIFFSFLFQGRKKGAQEQGKEELSLFLLCSSVLVSQIPEFQEDWDLHVG